MFAKILHVVTTTALLVTVSIAAEVCTNREIRLAGGSSPLEGRVEVCFNNQWGTVCGNSWTEDNARVACRQLGFSTEGAVSVVANTHFGDGSGNIHLAGVQCSGDEVNLTDCMSIPPHTSDHCSHDNDTGLFCHKKGFSCQDGQIQLVGGSINNEGRVEVCYNNRYGTVCDDYWDDNDATVVCKQLGFSATGSLAISNAVFGRGYGPVYLDDVNCSGAERNINECPHRGVNVHNCDHQQDASVLCRPVSPSCKNGAVRLVNGNLASEGRVEYCHNGVWGSVCHDSWQDVDAGVVCEQLGYQKMGALAVRFADFGEGEGLIFLDNVNCQGSEKFLNECSSNGLGVHNCGHQKDAGVICVDPSFSCTDGDVRLAGSSINGVGRVEVCYNNHFGTVCEDGWGHQEASVVCNQLGFDHEGAIPVHGAHYGQGVGLVYLDKLECSGSEANLLECPGRAVGTSPCFHSRDASVICRNTSSQSSSGGCQPGAVRLVGGTSSNEGRVEVCSSGQWGGICTNEWDNSDAAVVCRQLGFHGNGALASNNGFYGGGNVPIFLTGVSCSGNEINLLSCPREGLGGTSCDKHHAAVLCSPTSVPAACANGAVRLADGGVSGNQGRVEYCRNGRWGTVNGENWSWREGAVVCRQLGHDMTATRAIIAPTGSFGQGQGPIFLTDIRCFGIEGRLDECQHSSNGVQFHNVSLTNAAGIVCAALPCEDGAVRLSGGTQQGQGRVEVCSAGRWLSLCASEFTDNDAAQICSDLGHTQTGSLSVRGLFPSNSPTQSLVFNKLMCHTGNISSCLRRITDLTSQCSSGDLAEVICGGGGQCTNGDVRLVGDGSTSTQGRVEVCLGGEWGTVCDDSWDNNAATVVCNQLGLPGNAAISTSGFHFGQGAGKIFLSDIKCHGNESRLVDCSSSGYIAKDCQHLEDAGVICRATNTSITPTPTSNTIDQLTNTIIELSIPAAAALGAAIMAVCLTLVLVILYKWKRHQTKYQTVLKSPPSSTRSTPKIDGDEV